MDRKHVGVSFFFFFFFLFLFFCLFVCLFVLFLFLFFEIYGQGPYTSEPYPGPTAIWKNILSQPCSRTIFEMHTAQGA